MTEAKELEQAQSAALAPLSPEEEALVGRIKGKIDREDLILPQVRLSQALSQAVQEGDAKPGDFVNTLTGENYGTEFPLVIVSYFKGRFFAPKDGEFKGQVHVAAGDVAPDSWPDIYAGKHFADIPDAEEQFKELANETGEWGDGPPIRTTYNYVGLIASEDASDIPVRLSLQRTSRPTARKINTLMDMARAPWDKVFEIDSEQRETDGNRYYVVEAKQGGLTPPDLRTKALSLALELEKRDVVLHGDAPDGADEKGKPQSKPKAREGAVEV